MEFHEKLQHMRKQQGLTQEELAQALYVSRTAVSKWESGRGYPSIDSLKAIAGFFSLTVDELLSANEALALSEQKRVEGEGRLRSLVFGLLDLSALLFLFLPLFAHRGEDVVRAVGLSMLNGQSFLKIVCFVLSIGAATLGGIRLAMQILQLTRFGAAAQTVSLGLGLLLVLLFTVTLHPYPACLALVLLAVKVSMCIKGR